MTAFSRELAAQADVPRHESGGFTLVWGRGALGEVSLNHFYENLPPTSLSLYLHSYGAMLYFYISQVPRTHGPILM